MPKIPDRLRLTNGRLHMDDHSSVEEYLAGRNKVFRQGEGSIPVVLIDRAVLEHLVKMAAVGEAAVAAADSQYAIAS